VSAAFAASPPSARHGGGATVADIVFAFDPAIHRPIPVPESAPAEIAAAVSGAALAALVGGDLP